MKRVRFGSTDLDISSICFGTAAISGDGGGYGFGSITDSESQDLLSFAYDHGVNFFDTAPIYGFNVAEKRLGEFLKRERDKKIVVSKCGLGWYDNMRVNHDNSVEHCVAMLENSLRRMKTDYIDLYYIHAPHKDHSNEELIDALLDEKKKGKIRYIGLSNYSADELSKLENIDAVQNELNLFKDYDNDVKQIIKDKQLGSMSWGTFDKGFLLDKITKNRQFEKSDVRSKAIWFKKQDFDTKLKNLEVIKLFANKHEIDLVSLCINYGLSHDFNESVICGGKTKEQWQGIINYQERDLDFRELVNELL